MLSRYRRGGEKYGWEDKIMKGFEGTHKKFVLGPWVDQGWRGQGYKGGELFGGRIREGSRSSITSPYLITLHFQKEMGRWQQQALLHIAMLPNVRGFKGVKMSKDCNNRLFSSMSQIFTESLAVLRGRDGQIQFLARHKVCPVNCATALILQH